MGGIFPIEYWAGDLIQSYKESRNLLKCGELDQRRKRATEEKMCMGFRIFNSERAPLWDHHWEKDALPHNSSVVLPFYFFIFLWNPSIYPMVVVSEPQWILMSQMLKYDGIAGILHWTWQVGSSFSGGKLWEMPEGGLHHELFEPCPPVE